MIMEMKQFEKYTDNEIITKIIAGETPVFEILIRRYNPYLYKIGRTYGYSHHDVEDLMQETYVSAFYNLSKFENRSTFKTWLTKIMLNNCYQKKQKHSFKNETMVENKKMEKLDPMFHHHSNTEKTVVNKELGHVLENALNLIPEDYRMAFTLRELNGLSVAETMEVLSISESNVKARLSRAKNMLRSEIEKMYSPEDIYEFNLIYCNRIVELVMNKINVK